MTEASADVVMARYCRKPSRWSNGGAIKEEADRVWRSPPIPSRILYPSRISMKVRFI